MGTALKRPRKDATAPRRGGVAPLMRVLFITNRHRTGGWLAEAFARETAGEIHLQETVGSVAGLALLRDEAFDAVLVSHDPMELDALELIEGYRAGGADEPILVLGMQSEQEMSALSYQAGADGYACANTTTTRNLTWMLARAVERHQLIRENRRLNQAEQQRLQREHDEAERLLLEQRMLIGDLEAIRARGRSPAAAVKRQPDTPLSLPLPEQLVDHYRELLRTYVIMGSGNLACELSRLADLLSVAGVTAGQTMQLHVHVLEELVHGLGTRSTRHVMTRADLLVLEIMIHLVENYRHRYQERAHPPVQRVLPGFEDDGPIA
ncbi:MAG: hypothetical protein HUU20_08960 [Pirellulales bacterium]|nr:hypothetical protein [Pirellulales bacterium]